MKLLRIDDAAERLGLTKTLLEALEVEGHIRAADRVNGVPYYEQGDLDNGIHELLVKIEKASWRDMEMRMEAVERKVEALEAAVKDSGDGRRIY